MSGSTISRWNRVRIGLDPPPVHDRPFRGRAPPAGFLQRLVEQKKGIDGLTAEFYQPIAGEKPNEAASRTWNRLQAIVKTVAVVEPLRRALESQAKRIVAAFVYGSVSKGSDRATSDIDLMVVSDTLTHPDLIDALQGAEMSLARPV